MQKSVSSFQPMRYANFYTNLSWFLSSCRAKLKVPPMPYTTCIPLAQGCLLPYFFLQQPLPTRFWLHWPPYSSVLPRTHLVCLHLQLSASRILFYVPWNYGWVITYQENTGSQSFFMLSALLYFSLYHLLLSDICVWCHINYPCLLQWNGMPYSICKVWETGNN